MTTTFDLVFMYRESEQIVADCTWNDALTLKTRLAARIILKDIAQTSINFVKSVPPHLRDCMLAKDCDKDLRKSTILGPH